MEHQHNVTLTFLIIDNFLQFESEIIATYLFNNIQTANLVSNKWISSLIRIYEHLDLCHISDSHLS